MKGGGEQEVEEKSWRKERNETFESLIGGTEM